MDVRRIEDYEGRIVEFLEEGTPRLGLVLKVGRARVHLLDERGREEAVPVTRIYVVHALRPAQQAEFPHLVEALRAQIEARYREIDLELLWEGVREQEREYALPELAEQYFGAASGIEQAAMMRALLDDRFYFRRRGVRFVPRPVEQVEQLRHQEAQQRQRAEQKERAIAWLRAVLASEDPVAVPEQWAGLLERVEDFLLRRQVNDVARWLAEVDEERTARDVAYEVLVKTGRVDAAADPFLILAGLETSFRARALEAAERLIPFAGASDRADFIGAWTISIDDEETEEIDDALSLEPGAGGWRVGIHIADVAHYVRKGDVLDQEASRRGVTAYLPTQRVLMFPERLACDLASLRQGEVRPTLSLVLDVDEEGTVREATLVPGMIRVVQRLSYDEADQVIAEDAGEMGERLRRLLRWARRWAEERFQRGAIWLRRPEVKVRVRDGRIHIKRLDPGAPARFLVSELMVLMNHVAAEQAARRGIPIIFRAQDPPAHPPDDELRARLRHGFHLPSLGLLVLSQQDVLGDEPEMPAAAPSRERTRAAFLSDFKDLKPGDYVVHVDHGIGRFEGLVQLTAPDGIAQDFLLIRYADEARLYVPVDRLDLVQKYIGADGHPPRLDRLGGTSWLRTKARAVRAMRDLAEELLKLHAERKLIPGHAFSPDTPWQAEFEAGFEYELTPDQARALEEIKRDMERPVPMDRLLCGDVGFGKTEVAMRAAFKAVMDGKQVAVLAPTTVLVEQHYRTFTRRFAPFPITIAQLSRFCSRAEIARTLRGLEEGTVDIVIGTHRLLSRDVRFHDLGLVIIDEEQRFGVWHKERLKQLRHRVDVLTLTATPIPRTLYMALTGLRDLSVIQTPPPDRLAVQTLIVPFSPALIRRAIERELERGGQVFFVHNEIETIHEIVHLIRQLVPHARIGIAHSRLPERELERAVLRFVRQELDVLVTTTIIENGLDIPNANTILINHAERFGLADLYQLRGRVGRSHRLAYAYLLTPPESTLSTIARQRLAALKEFSDLGAGFRLAALDLELRGAGNLLGPEQSGHINALGFELYCQLLERTIRELRGETIEEEIVPQITLRLSLRIPEAYVPEMSQRLHIYKRLASARTEQKLAELREELKDRYGPPPPEVERLLLLGSIRNAAISLRVRAIERELSHITIRFADPDRVTPRQRRAFLAVHPSAEFTSDGALRYTIAAQNEHELLLRLRDDLLLLHAEAYNSSGTGDMRRGRTR